jgi:hypothetical protein
MNEELWFPRAVAVGRNSDCYVSEYGRSNRVQRFRADGSAVGACLALRGPG